MDRNIQTIAGNLQNLPPNQQKWSCDTDLNPVYFFYLNTVKEQRLRAVKKNKRNINKPKIKVSRTYYITNVLKDRWWEGEGGAAVANHVKRKSHD